MQKRKRLFGALFVIALAMITVCLLTTGATAVLLVDDSLQSSTSGTRLGGQFANGGWQVTGQYDAIYWHLPYPVHSGTAEFYVKTLYANECRSWMNDKTELYHMYDWTFGDADNDYSGYRDNPYKHFLRKIGCVGGSTDAMELLWKIDYAVDEPDSPVLSWNPGVNYRFTESWYPDGSGNSVVEIRRDGQLLRTISLPGTFNPQGPCVRIGASSRRMADYGAPLDAVYSYVKVWDNSASVPEVPQLTAPASGGSTSSTSPRIIWAYTPASKYQVRLNVSNSPTSGIVWDSGEVVSNKNWCIAGPVASPQNYYVFVRLWNSAGWSSWSANGHLITVNTSYVVPNNGVVTVSGRSFYDANGHYLGLGATYMRALRDCKYDRDLYRSNCAFLASQGINFIRMLSMVSWTNKEIMPIGGENWDGAWIAGWTDYWQQFRDCIDIAYEYGLRSEVVIFADAQNCMPSEGDRYTHMDGIIGNINGRDHKVVFIEVANEYWQNGLNVTQLRTYGEYLTARIGRLVALSSSGPDSLTTIYSGTSADMATEHTERDITTFEGGWLPVRSSWSLLGTPGVPAPISNDEPIGPGSSVSAENDPIKLVSAACFSWMAGLTSYVYHSTSGVAGDRRFETLPGVREYKHLKNILPAALSSWTRNDGLEAAAPFTVYCNGVPNQYWTSNPSASTGCHRNIGAWHDNEFVCYPQGILSGGLTLQARQNVTFTVYNPMTGAIVMGPISKSSGEQIGLAQGPGAYIIKGTGNTVPSCPSDSFGYANGALNGNGGWYGTAGSSRIEVVNGMVRLWGGAGSYDAVRSTYCEGSGGCIPVTIKVYAGSGARTIWSLWIDDTSGNNLARWYGTANSARGRIASTGDVTAEQTLQAGWNTLLVRIYPATNTSQFSFNGNDIGTLSHSSQGAGDILGRIRLEAMDNADAVGHYLYFDDLSTEGDTTPPGPVTSFVATGGVGQVSLSWTNPTDGDFAGTMIRFSTAGYPGSPTGGTQCYSGTGTSTTHSGLASGVTYYYSAFAYDATPNYSSVATASATTTDSTPPGNVTSFVATAGDGQNSLSWTNPGDGDLAGVKIMFKTTGYPTGPTDGTQCYNALGTSTVHSGLTNGVTYYYKAFAYDAGPNYASGAQASGTPNDTTPPGNVTGFIATSGDMQNTLSWTKPGDADLAGVKIMFKTTGYPTSPTDGTQVYSGMGTSTVHGSLTNGVTYYYKAFAFDEVPNYASGAQASGVPADVTPPGPVTSFVCTASDAKNTLTWTNPTAGDFAGTMIRFKTTGYPTGPTDGTQCYYGTGTSYNHTGLTNGVTYYYSAFARDEVPNYSTKVNASGMPDYIYSFRDTFPYANGALNGNGGWSGTATSSHVAIDNGCVKIIGGAGAYWATKTVSCADQGWGYIWVRLKINGEVGTSNIWSLWINDSSGRNLARWYGSGTTARGRIGNTANVTATQTLSGAWQTIDVKINPSANTSQFFFNGVSIGTLSHASEGAGDAIGQLRFERMDNSGGAGNNLFFDDLRVGGS